MTNDDSQQRLTSDELRQWLGDASAEELVRFAASGPPGGHDGPRDDFEPERYVIGWEWHALSVTPLSAWIPVPDDVLSAVGGLDVADDMIELFPTGDSSMSFDAVIARWAVYDPSRMKCTIEIRTADGRTWPLEAVSAEAFEVAIPADCADDVQDFDDLKAIRASIDLCPFADDLLALDRIELELGDWMTFTPLTRQERGQRVEEIEPAVAARLGIGTTVHVIPQAESVSVGVVVETPGRRFEVRVNRSPWYELSQPGDGLMWAIVTTRVTSQSLTIQIRLRER